jgi:hypothetical protein
MQGWLDGWMASCLALAVCCIRGALLESPSGRLSVQRTISRSSSPPPPPSPGRHNNGGLFFLYIPHHQHLRLLWPRPRPLLSPGLALIRCTHNTLQGCYFAPAAAAHYHIMCCELGPSRPHLVTIERREKKEKKNKRGEKTRREREGRPDKM